MNQVKINNVQGDVVKEKTINILSGIKRKKKENILDVLVISEIKSKVNLKDETLKTIHYDEVNSSYWRPFCNEPHILDLINDYKVQISGKVNFKVQERFLSKEPLTQNKLAELFRTTQKKILVVDPFSINDYYKSIILSFNQFNIGGCLVILCQSIPHSLYEDMKLEIEAHFPMLNACYLDYTCSYIHYIFPISTKEQFFRSLSNLAFGSMKFSKKIESTDVDDISENITDEEIREYGF